MADNNGEMYGAQKKNRINFFSKLIMLFTVSMTMIFQHMVGLQNSEVRQIILGVSMCTVTGMVAWGLSLKYNENIQMAEKRFLLYSGVSTVLCSIYFLYMYYIDINEEILTIAGTAAYSTVFIESARYKYVSYRGGYEDTPGMRPYIYIPLAIFISLLFIGGIDNGNIKIDSDFMLSLMFLLLSILFSSGTYLLVEYIFHGKEKTRKTARRTTRKNVQRK